LKNRRINVPRSADFSENSVFPVFCGVFCALARAEHTAKKLGVPNPGAQKEMYNDVTVTELWVSELRVARRSATARPFWMAIPGVFDTGYCHPKRARGKP